MAEVLKSIISQGKNKIDSWFGCILIYLIVCQMELPRVRVLRTMMFFKWPWIWPLLRFLEAPFNHVSLHPYLYTIWLSLLFCFRQPAHLGFSNSNRIECLGNASSSEGLLPSLVTWGSHHPTEVCVSAAYSSKLGRVFDVLGWVHDSNSRCVGLVQNSLAHKHIPVKMLFCQWWGGTYFPPLTYWSSFFKEKNRVSDKFFKGVPRVCNYTFTRSTRVLTKKKEVFF